MTALRHRRQAFASRPSTAHSYLEPHLPGLQNDGRDAGPTAVVLVEAPDGTSIEITVPYLPTGGRSRPAPGSTAEIVLDSDRGTYVVRFPLGGPSGP